MTEAAQARAAAMPMEAKKNALRQTQDGLWKVEFTVKAEDMPQAILEAPMGTRYQLAAVQIGDNEEAVPARETTEGAKAKRHFEAMCQDQEFMRWAHEKWRGVFAAGGGVPDTRQAAKDLMRIQSANELLEHPEKWQALYDEYKYKDNAR